MFSKLRNYFRKYDNTKKVISTKMKIHLVDVGESMVKYTQEDAERELEEYRRKGISPKMKIHLVDVGESMVKYAQEDAERELEEYRRKGLVKLVDKP